MLSIVVYLFIFTTISYFIAIIKLVNKDFDNSAKIPVFIKAGLILFFGKIFPLMMLEDKSGIFCVGFLIDAILYIIFLIGFFIRFKSTSWNSKSRIFIPLFLILLQPFSLYAILKGNINIYIVCTITLFTSLLVLFSYGHYFILEEAAIAKKTDNLAFSFDNKKIFDGFTKFDFIGALLLTAIFGALIFTKLGSHEAPETFATFNTSENSSDAIIEFGEYHYITRIALFEGYDNIVCSFSNYDYDKKDWDVFDERREINGVFKWHMIDVYDYAASIGLVFRDRPAYVHEIVFLDENGDIVTPVNKADYPELFDEQDTFPEKQTYFYNTMFDEVYHARTGYEFEHNYSIYETTHPPFGKTIISLGIKIFGMNPFGYRFASAVFGSLLIFLFFIVIFLITKNRLATYLTTILLASSFMSFTLSRIATIDIFVAVFSLLMFAGMYIYFTYPDIAGKRQYIVLLITGIFMGFSVATKWTGVYASAGIAVIFFYKIFTHCYANRAELKKLKVLIPLCFVFFLFIPAAIYILSFKEYTDVYNDKGLIRQAIDNSIYMFSYHSGVKDFHRFSSEWYQWLIDYNPLLDALDYIDDQTVSTVSTFINPLICVISLLMLIFNIYLWRIKKDYKSAILVILYFSMLLPWLLIHRTVFIYQYFISLIISILMTGYGFYWLSKKNKIWNIIFITIAILSLLLFILFYPVISGAYFQVPFAEKYIHWFNSWVFY